MKRTVTYHATVTGRCHPSVESVDVRVTAPAPELVARILREKTTGGVVDRKGGEPLWHHQTREKAFRLAYEAVIEVEEGVVHHGPGDMTPRAGGVRADSLDPSPMADSCDPRIRRWAAEATRGRTSVFRAVQALAHAASSSIEYCHGRFRDGCYSATQALEAGRGSCDEFAHVLAALCRSVGIPCLVASGLAYDREHAEEHAWNLVSPDGREWWPVDGTSGVEMFFFRWPRIPLWVGADCSLRPRTVRWQHPPAPASTGKPLVSIQFEHRFTVQPAEEHRLELAGAWLQCSSATEGLCTLDVRCPPGMSSGGWLPAVVTPSEGLWVGPQTASVPDKALCPVGPDGIFRLQIPVRLARPAPPRHVLVFPLSVRVPGGKELWVDIGQSASELRVARSDRG